MDRKSFFKKLGIGVATVVVAPKVFAEVEEPKSEFVEVRLFDQGNELPRWQYKRPIVSKQSKCISIPIKGKARVDNVVYYNTETKQPIFGILYGIGWIVNDGIFTIK